MKPLPMLLGVSALGMLLAGYLAGSFALSSVPPGLHSSSRDIILPGSAASNDPALAAAWQRLRSGGDTLANESQALRQRWRDFSTALKRIHPEAAEISDSAGARRALALASEWLDEREKAATDSRMVGVDSAHREALAEIASLRTDLEELRRLSSTSLSSRLENLLVLGADRRTPQGIELVWIPDETKGTAGGFWAARKEISLAHYQTVAGQAPPSLFRKPSGTAGISEADIDRQIQNARNAFLAKAGAANRESASLVFDRTQAPALRAQLRRTAQARAREQAAGYEKLPADLANLSSRSDTRAFIDKLQQSDLPGSDWQYRLPTKSEWTLLQGKVDGIGTPDLSEWLHDDERPVDRNWQSDTPATAPGTVGFRVVLAEAR